MLPTSKLPARAMIIDDEKHVAVYSVSLLEFIYIYIYIEAASSEVITRSFNCMRRIYCSTKHGESHEVAHICLAALDMHVQASSHWEKSFKKLHCKPASTVELIRKCSEHTNIEMQRKAHRVYNHGRGFRVMSKVI